MLFSIASPENAAPNNISPRAHRRLEGVRERVESSQNRHRLRHGLGEFRIENGELRQGLGISARHFFMRPVPTDHRIALAFTARSGGGRNRDEREHWAPRESIAFVVAHRSAVGEKKIAALGGVHAAAPAKAHDTVYFHSTCKLSSGLDVALPGTLVSRIIDRKLNPGLGQP